MSDCVATNGDSAKKSILRGQNHADNSDKSGKDNSDKSGENDDYNEFEDDDDNEFNYRNVQCQIGIMWRDLTKQNKTWWKNRAHHLNSRVNVLALLHKIPNFLTTKSFIKKAILNDWRNVCQILRQLVQLPYIREENFNNQEIVRIRR